jgi:putative Holliday junction resolvase
MVGIRILGIDYGESRIGIAVSDGLGITAQPVSVIKKGKTFEEDIRNLSEIIKSYDGVNEIVVGLPKTMKGEVGKQAHKVLEFVEALKKGLNLAITVWDERLTTVEAEKTLISAGLSRKKRKKVIDMSAAACILQNYLDRKHK